MAIGKGGEMKVNKQKFDAVLSEMVRAEPQKRAETKPAKKAKPQKRTR